jgi:hypothetical protein
LLDHVIHREVLGSDLDLDRLFAAQL